MPPKPPPPIPIILLGTELLCKQNGGTKLICVQLTLPILGWRIYMPPVVLISMYAYE